MIKSHYENAVQLCKFLILFYMPRLPWKRFQTIFLNPCGRMNTTRSQASEISGDLYQKSSFAQQTIFVPDYFSLHTTLQQCQICVEQNSVLAVWFTICIKNINKNKFNNVCIIVYSIFFFFFKSSAGHNTRIQDLIFYLFIDTKFPINTRVKQTPKMTQHSCAITFSNLSMFNNGKKKLF